jgi:excinuclease ABC subunit B
MKDAAGNLEFEEAARLRDEIKRLRGIELAVMDDPTAKFSTPPGEASRAQRGPGFARAPSSRGGKPGTRTVKSKSR